MAEQKLTGAPRAEKGKGAARKLRAQGLVPAIVYGRGSDPLPISVNARELNHVLRTDAGFNVLIDLHVDGDQHLAMPKEIQRDIVRGEFLHADFIKISRTEKIQVNIPIEITGSEDAPGVKEGGVVEHHLWELSIESLPTDVPASISADISALEINDALHVSDLTAPDNVTILTPEEETVVAVIPAPIMRVETEEALEAEAAAAAAAEAAEGVEGEEGEAAAGGEGGGGGGGDSGGGDSSGDDES